MISLFAFWRDPRLTSCLCRLPFEVTMITYITLIAHIARRDVAQYFEVCEISGDMMRIFINKPNDIANGSLGAFAFVAIASISHL